MGVGVVGSRKLGFQGQDRIIHSFTHSTDALSSVLGAVWDTKGAESFNSYPLRNPYLTWEYMEEEGNVSKIRQ